MDQNDDIYLRASDAMTAVFEVLDNATHNLENSADDSEQEESKEQPLVQPPDEAESKEQPLVQTPGEEERKEPIVLNP